MKRIFLIIVLIGGIAAEGAFAQKQKPKAPPAKPALPVLRWTNEDALPLAEAKQRLKKLRPGSAVRLLSKIVSAMEKKDWKLARGLWKSSSADSEWGFLFHFLGIQIGLELAQADVNPTQSNQFAGEALRAVSNLMLEPEATRFRKEIYLTRVGLEKILSNNHYKLGLKNKARDHYFKYFELLQKDSGLKEVDGKTAENFVRSCLEKSSIHPNCPTWIKALILSFGRKSDFSNWLGGQFKDFEPPPLIESQSGSVFDSKSYREPSEVLDQPAWLEILDVLKEEKFSRARNKIEEFLGDYPKSQYEHRARYWLGVSNARTGRSKEAKEIFEELSLQLSLSYYGLLASWELGRSLEIDNRSGGPIVKTSDISLRPDEVSSLERATQLLGAEVKSLAALELSVLRPRAEHPSAFLIYLAQLKSQAKDHLQAFNVFGELMDRAYPDILTKDALSIFFPTELLKSIEKLLVNTELDPVLVLSLIKQESGFFPNAVSSANAVGLMQVLHTTAQDAGFKGSAEELKEPQANIQFGSKHLAGLMKKFKGNKIYSLAAYNAGARRVEGWIRDFEGRKGALFVESIPYTETRNYVSNIVRNYYWYSQVLGLKSPKSVDSFWE